MLDKLRFWLCELGMQRSHELNEYNNLKRFYTAKNDTDGLETLEEIEKKYNEVYDERVEVIENYMKIVKFTDMYKSELEKYLETKNPADLAYSKLVLNIILGNKDKLEENITELNTAIALVKNEGTD